MGAEYIIANSLIALQKKKGRREISLGELSDLGIYIQKMSVEKDIDAIFLTSQDQWEMAIYDFSDYFEYNRERQSICIKQTKKIVDLANRFMGYLPWEVLSFLVETTNNFAIASLSMSEKTSS